MYDSAPFLDLMARIEFEELEDADPQLGSLAGLLADEAWADVTPLVPRCPGDPVVDIDKDESTELLFGRFWAVKEAGVRRGISAFVGLCLLA